MGVKCYLQKEYITQHTPETFVNASAKPHAQRETLWQITI